MRKTCAFKFYARACKVRKDGTVHLEVSLSVDGRRQFIMLPFSCKLSDFQKKKKPDQIQDYLDSMTFTINEYILIMTQRHIPITLETLSKAIRAGGIFDRITTVKELFDDYNGLMEKKAFKSITFNHYLKYLRTTNEFLSIVDSEKPIKEVSNADILRFQTHIYSKFATNTAAGNMVRLKAYFRYAKDNNIIDINPTANIKVRRTPNPDIVYLSDEEYQLLKDKDMHSDRLNRIRDLWIFQASSGLSYCDMAKICKDDIQVSDGIYFIVKQREKTSVKYVSVILPDGIEILEKYNYILPVLSNQRYNSYLAECMDIAGITKHITTHCARHQYATRLLAARIPMSTIQHTLGHSSIVMTERYYAALSDSTILQQVSEAMYKKDCQN